MRYALVPFALVSLAPSRAFAHADGLPVGPHDVWHHWSFDPWLWAPLLLLHWLYGRGVLNAWARAGGGRIVERWRVGAFVGGEAVLIAALITPLDALGGALLAAHMTQHILLTTLAPFLLVLGAAERAWTWALPLRWRALGRAMFMRALMQAWRWLTRPVIALVLHSVALWFWHTPALFDAALRDEGVHTLEHVSFFATAIVFWSATVRRATTPASAAAIVLAVFVQCGMLGAILALAPQPLYAYGDRPMLWGLSAIEDQQIAGLLMWAPASLAYLAPFAWFASRIFTEPQPRGRLRESHGIMRASTSSRSMK
jgi:putative membrane protein